MTHEEQAREALSGGQWPVIVGTNDKIVARIAAALAQVERETLERAEAAVIKTLEGDYEWDRKDVINTFRALAEPTKEGK